MTQVSIMYDNLLALLNDVIDNTSNDNFIASLSAPRDNQFMDILEALQTQIEEINSAKDNLTLYPNYSIIEGLLTKIHQDFPEYNVPRYNELRVILSISKVITDQIGDLTDLTDIDVNQFELISSAQTFTLTQSFYFYENPQSFIDSILLFEPCRYTELETELRGSSISLMLYFIFLSKIGQQANVLSTDKYLLIKSGQSAYPKRINSFLLLLMISDGLTIHIPKSYSMMINNPWKSEIKIENKYQQFLDVFDVISEYNSSRDIIEKYLKIYQVIEDYMYKHSLVKLEREKNGQIFSLRDFKRMNEQVSDKEINVLKNFITTVFELEESPGLKFKIKCHTSWSSLLTFIPNVDEINKTIKQFKIMEGERHFTYTSVTNNNVAKFFAQLIYYVRNSIVHNKTTEFHLTYRTLDEHTFCIIEKFLIPNLESIIFYLTVKPSSQLVWFQNPSMNIWSDN